MMGDDAAGSVSRVSGMHSASKDTLTAFTSLEDSLISNVFGVGMTLKQFHNLLSEA